MFTGLLPLSVAQLQLPAKVRVELRAGEIRDRFGNPFGGTAWDHVLLDPTGDHDDDGLSNHDEANRFLNQSVQPRYRRRRYAGRI